MKKLDLNDAEKQFLRSLNTSELDEAIGGETGSETSVEVPTDLLGKLLSYADVVSLDEAKQATGKSAAKGESSSPWEAGFGASGATKKEQLNVTDDAVAALQAFPVKTSFQLDELSVVDELGELDESTASEQSAVLLTKSKAPKEEASPTPLSSASSAPKSAPLVAASEPKPFSVSQPAVSETPVATLPALPKAPTPSAGVVAALPVVQGVVASEVDAEVSSEETDHTGAGVSYRQSELQDQDQASSFVSRLSKLFSRRKLSRFLGELEVFQELSPEAVGEIALHVKEIEVSAGTPIIRQGDVADCMYILARGEVNIPILDKKTHRQFSIKLGPGQLFGEMALLTGERRFADVFAQTDCSCLILHKQAVDELIRKVPEVARLLTSILGKRLMQSGEIQEVGDYKLLGQLGKGGMAYVFEAVHKRKDRVVAMKMLSHELVYQGNFAENFRMEAEVLASLRHPHIVDFIAIQEAYATFFLIMEKLNGLDLNQRIERSGAFSSAETREILIQASRALGYAHDHGIIHRDIKPSNIMFTDFGKVKVGDFGLALQVKAEESGEGAPKKAIEGTPTYMAPEQIMRRQLDRRVDIYALGVVAYKMLVGRPPFMGNLQDVLNSHLNVPLPSLKEQIPSLPDDLDLFVRKATAKKPQHRFQDAYEILDHFGVERRADDLPEVGVRTLTFVFAPGKANDVEEIVESCKRQAAGNHSIQLHDSLEG